VPERRYRLLILCSHPVPYASPAFRRMAQHPRLEIEVAYCSMQGAEAAMDHEFGREVQWDLPLLEGYPWVCVPNRSPRPKLGRFFGLINPGLWKLVRSGNYDAVLAYTGYRYLSFWIAATAARLGRVPLLSSTDAYSLRGIRPDRWKVLLKRFILPLIYRVNDFVVVPSEATSRFVASLGVPRQRILFAPGGFDMEWWAGEAARSDRDETRARFGVSGDSPVFLFCGKLQPWKRPQDLLHAFARLTPCNGYAVFAGDGPLRAALEAEAKALGVEQRVLFPGFVKQTELPALYRAADVLVLPSDYDGCPLVVCEAMSCGCPVVLSDAIPGRFELVRHGDTGFVYRCGDVDALASILAEVASDRKRLETMSAAAAERMRAWSVLAYVDALLHALDQAIPSGQACKSRQRASAIS